MNAGQVVGLVLVTLLVSVVLWVITRVLLRHLVVWLTERFRLCGACGGPARFRVDDRRGYPFWVCAACADNKLGQFAVPRLIDSGVLTPIERTEVKP